MKKLMTLLAVLALATSAQAADITWTGVVDIEWDASTANWTGDATTYSDGDHITIDTAGTIKMNLPHMDPATVNVNVSAGNTLTFEWKAFGFTWGAAAFESGTITKTGAGTWRWFDQSGFWCCGAATTAVYNINEGVWQYDHRHEFGERALGDGSTVNLNGAEFFYNEGNWGGGAFFRGATTFNVTADSTLRIASGASSIVGGWAENVVEVSINADATLSAIPASGTLYWDNELLIDVSGNSAGKMDVLGSLALTDDAALTLNVTGVQSGPIVLVDYAGGFLTGTFATVSGLPEGGSLDYTFNNGTQIAFIPQLQSLLADLNSNGFVDFEDLTILLANWNKDVGAADGNLVEPAITVVNFADLTVLLADWTGPGPAGSPEAALGEAVPEPSTLLLALLATLGLSFYRRRRRRAF